MRISIAAILALFSAGAHAHPGHIAPVAGHTHTLGELALVGFVPVAAALVLLGVVVYRARQRND